MEAGAYTFWQADTQLSGVRSTMREGGMPQMPQDGNMPQMPQDGNMPPVLDEMKDRGNSTDPAGLESSVTFQISDGGNQFIQVGPAA